MHIIGGQFRRHALVTPKGDTTRPTSGKLREAVFNMCQHSVADAIFLDVCAGSGAMGLEALSRGAKEAIFIEHNKAAAAVIHTNIKKLQVEKDSRLITKDALTGLETLVKEKKVIDLCYIDPPYHQEKLIFNLLTFFDQHTDLLHPDGTLFVEDAYDTKHEDLNFSSLKLSDTRKFGDSKLYIYLLNH